jgi:ribosomal protein S18 acetylase RimI-like enzyme
MYVSPQRSQEFAGLAQQAALDALGEDGMQDSIYVDGIACHPDYQGMGYGGALLDTATDMVSPIPFLPPICLMIVTGRCSEPEGLAII